MIATGIQCPSGRISEMRTDGVDIISIGQVKFEGSKAFEKYAVRSPLTKVIYEYKHNPYTGNMEETSRAVPI